MSEPQPPSVHEALVGVMRDVIAIGKTDKNDFHGFLFRGIDTVLDHVGPALRTHGVLVLPELRDLQSRDVESVNKEGKNKTSREITVTVAYHFIGPAGDRIEPPVLVPGEAQDTGDKAVSKAMSVAYRTALIEALSIPTRGRDPDADTYERHDPLLSLKNQVMAAAKSREWDIDQLSADYAEWSQGGDIRTADADSLTDYLKYLNPPKRMRRKPLESSSDDQ